MYETFYGLKERAFSLLPDPAYLYLSRQHEMALTLLEYSLENQAGFCVITGKAGTGKTTLLRRLLNQVGKDVSVGLISNTHHSFGELLRWILHAFGLEKAEGTRAELHQVFVDYLIAQYAKNRRTMLIIDEAQNMSADALEELRMLSNINSEKDLLLQVILVGQPPLREILRRPELEQFAQRVAVDYHLEALSREETRAYILHRVTVAGGESELFTEDACEAVFVHTQGLPRLINLLCDFALVYAYAEHAAVVTGELVDLVVSERERHGALPVFAGGEKRAAPPVPSAGAGATETVRSAAPPPKSATQHLARPDLSERGGKAIASSTGRAVSPAERPPTAAPAMGVDQRRGEQRRPASIGPASAAAVSRAGAVDIPSGVSELRQASVQAARRQGGAAGGQPKSVETLNRDASGSKQLAKAEGGRGPGRAAAMTKATKRYLRVGAVAGLFLAAPVVWSVFVQKPPPAAPVGVQSQQPLVPVTTEVEVAATPASAAGVDASAAPVRPAGGQQDQARLDLLKRERDAAVEMAKAIERERDALLAAAKARESALVAEREAMLAKQRQQQRERRAASAALKVERDVVSLQAVDPATAPAPDPVTEPARESVSEAPARSPAPEILSEVPASATVLAEPTGAIEPPPAPPAHAPEAGSEPEEIVEASPFSANPCNGPSAKFLSTCR